MCIAVLLKKDVKISEATLKNCWENNDDGAGIGFAYGGNIYIRKGYTKFESFYKSFLEIRQKFNPTMILHFRWATQGKRNTRNCHPFYINKNIMFCHNGVITHIAYDSELSDTYLFNQTVLKKLPIDFYKNEILMELIRRYSSYSKFLFLNNEGQYYILNESAGHWNGGVWYSSEDYSWKRYGYSGNRGTWNKNNYNYESYYQYDYYDNYQNNNKNTKIVKFHDKEYLCVECGIKLYTSIDIDRLLCSKCYYKFIKNT